MYLERMEKAHTRWCSRAYRVAAALEPGGGKGLFTEIGTCASHRALIVRAVDGRQRGTNVLPQGFCCSPQPCCPRSLSLYCSHCSQALQTGSDEHFVAYRVQQCQAFLVEGTCRRMVALGC